MSEGPHYWQHEVSGVLRPAIMRYLRGERMSGEDIAAMRAYLRQWIMAPVWHSGPDVEDLRSRIDELTDRPSISLWLIDAEAACIDPL